MFQLSHKLKSVSVTLAKKLGFLNDKQAKEADQLIDREGGDTPTLGLLVDKGMLDIRQAAKVRELRQKEQPSDELNEQIKKAQCAIRRLSPGR